MEGKIQKVCETNTFCKCISCGDKKSSYSLSPYYAWSLCQSLGKGKREVKKDEKIKVPVL